MELLSLKLSFLIMGISGISAQIILLRELLVSFLGNELTIGMILANWLILEAIGSFFIGKSVEKVKRELEVYVFLQLIFSIAFPFSIYLSRIFKNILLITPGEGLGLIPIYYCSLLILLPSALPHGALFTYGCRLSNKVQRKEASSIGDVYILETAGSIIGGLLITFLMIQYLNSFEIAFTISLINSLISVILLGSKSELSVKYRKTLSGISVLYLFLFIYLLFTPISEKINYSSIKLQWKGLNVIHNENSIYGNITVSKSGEQFTFFTDGVPSITTPVPDIASIEDFVHFPMLFHERPQSILVLSGGAGGMIHEILKHPVKEVNYVELDPLLLKLLRKFSTPLTQSELSDKRVRIHFTDGRFFARKTEKLFDIIFIGLSSPQELQTNRLFSFEFFSIVKDKMNQGGVMALTLPGSLTYISPELRDLNGCILDTLKNVFPYVRIIPGDTNIFIASNSARIDKTNTPEIVQRLRDRKIETSLFTKPYIEYRLHPRWLDWFSKSMERKELQINSDFRPIGVFLNLSYWNALFSPYFSEIFRWFKGFTFKYAIFIIILITIIFVTIFLLKPKITKTAIPYAIFTSGMADMILDLVIIFSFQISFGYLYYQIGILITLFMMGVLISSHYMTKHLEKIRREISLFLGMELWVICFSLILPYVLSFQYIYPDNQINYTILYITFLVMSFLCGTLVGFEFPLASKIYLQTHPKGEAIGYTAGLIYSADLFGGFLGGLLGGIFILPIIGLRDSCLSMAGLKMSSFILITIFLKVQGQQRK